jgi:Acyl-coenzyme A:6-aminopenicillanic acid acyl-transferase
MAQVRRTYHPAFTALCYAGRLPGHTFATNDYGLVQTINDIRALERRPGVPRCFLARAILDCRDVESALDLIRSTARAGGYHHSLACSSDARLYSVEAPPGAMVAVEVTQPLVYANHLIHGPLVDLPQYIVGGSVFGQKFGEQVLDTVRPTRSEHYAPAPREAVPSCSHLKPPTTGTRLWPPRCSRSTRRVSHAGLTTHTRGCCTVNALRWRRRGDDYVTQNHDERGLTCWTSPIEPRRPVGITTTRFGVCALLCL